METISITRWSDFGAEVDRLRERFAKVEMPVVGGVQIHSAPRLLFRGQANVSWALETTLERKERRPRTVESYLELACRHVQEIESLIGKNWDLPSFPELREAIGAKSTHSYVHLPAYDYLVYLRHHGFPSPLLDWTESPFVAAYFACIGSLGSDSAVFCYVERPEGFKGGYVTQPTIHVMGPYVRTHPRHFTQRAWYSVAARWDDQSDRHTFCSHADVFALDSKSQDVLIKLVLPYSMRRDALRALSDYNINEFTLFQTEDSLVKAIESRLFDFEAESE